MTRSLTVRWPDARPFRRRAGRPIRLLAVSDETDPALEQARNRERMGGLDGVVGCGDLDPDYLAFLGDAFNVPLVWVLGNHDRPQAEAYRLLPPPLEAGWEERFPLPVFGLSWAHEGARRDPWGAWWQMLRVGPGELIRPRPVLLASHVPPRGAGDGPDRYHHGEEAYRWLLGRLRPPLWLHGHTTVASVPDWRVRVGPTTLVNVTGSVLVEVTPPADEAQAAAGSG